jgi:predicted lipoprotein with Yx(FWY)xxD motif
MGRSKLARWILAGTGCLVLSACGTGANAPAASTGSSATVQTAKKTVDGTSKVVLTDPHGFTLYWFKPDTATTIACTGGCATAWPPLVAPAGAANKSSGIPGTVTTVDGPNGNQVVYNGHPLYTYSKDKDGGDVYGNGVGGSWFVATPDLASAVAANAAAAAGGYGAGRYGAQPSSSP